MTADKTVGDYVSLQRGNTYSGKLVGLPGPALLVWAQLNPAGASALGTSRHLAASVPRKSPFAVAIFTSH